MRLNHLNLCVDQLDEARDFFATFLDFQFVEQKGAAIVDRIGKGGFWMSGTVRRAGDGTPLAKQRIQIWAHTTEGQEHEPQSHGATLTDKDGKFRLEMPQIIPIFGQPHGHLAYDSGEFQTVFLRPVMKSAKDKSLEAHFVLQPA